MAERIKVEYFEEPPVVLEVGGRRSWQAETADQFCNIWHETTEGSDHVTRWVKSSYDGRMARIGRGIMPSAKHLEFCG